MKSKQINKKIEILENLIQATKEHKGESFSKEEFFLDFLELTPEDLELMIPIIAKKLPKLKYLSLNNNNNIRSLPYNIEELKNLKILSVQGCNLETLPESLKNNNNLEIIGLPIDNFNLSRFKQSQGIPSVEGQPSSSKRPLKKPRLWTVSDGHQIPVAKGKKRLGPSLK